MHRPRCLDLAILCGLAATAASQDASITDSIAISLQSPLATDTNLSPPPPLTSFSTQSSPTMSSVMPSSTSTTPTPNLCSPIKGSTICDSWEKSFVDYTTLRSGKWPNANKDTLAQGDVSAFDAWASTLTSQVWYPSPFDSDVVLFASGCFRQKPVIRYPTSFLCAKVVALDSSPQVNNKTSGSEAQSFIGGCRQNGPGTVDSQPPSLCPGPCMAYVDTILDALSSNADCLGLGGSELQRVKATLKQSCDRMQQQSQAHSLECKMGNSADLTTCGFGNRTMAISYCTKNAGDSCCGFANLLGTPTSIWTTTTIIAVVGGTLAFIAVLALSHAT
ncbi:hypothetical protein BC829DRAFT_445384 [Chytridium lagenaria]|nr:hypothetical protein BC829DRAFT_445384 [Chytridium lagenaria]